MEYVGAMIRYCRERTGETDYGASNGTSQIVALQAMRDAQAFIQGAIYKQIPNAFDAPSILALVPGQSVYAFPSNVYAGGNVLLLEYLPSGASSEERWALEYRSLSNFSSGTGEPTGYCFSGGSIYLDPAPQSPAATLRLWSAITLDDPDLRRGQVSEVQFSGDGLTVARLVLSPADGLVDDEAKLLFGENFVVCVSDREGLVKVRNAYYSSFAVASSTLTLSSSVAAGSVLAGDFVTIGPNTTTHSKLDASLCRAMMNEYCMRILTSARSSVELPDFEDIMSREETKILAVYRRLVRDRKRVPYYGKFA